MKKLIAVVLAVIMVLSISAAAFAEGDMPEKDVSVICATNAGGAMDTAVRLLTPHLEEICGVNFPVTNIAGSAGWVALAQLMAGNSRNYEVCYVAFPQIIVASMDPSAQLGITIDDYKPIALDVDDSNILIAIGGEERFTNLEQFIEYAKSNDVLVGTSAGVYSDDNVCKTYILEAVPGLKFQTVHFTSTSEGKAALLGGNIDILICNVSEAVSQAQSGEVLPVAVCADERFADLPDTQTFTELGYDVVCGSTRGYVAKGDISDEMYEKLCSVFDAAMSSEEYISAATERYFGLNKLIGADFAEWLDAQNEDMEEMYSNLK